MQLNTSESDFDTDANPRYQIREEIAEGGMARVFRAKDSNLNREVAVKTILPKLMEDNRSVERFLMEARSAASLEHPNIVPVHDLGFLAGTGPYMTMKLVEGQDLEQVISSLREGDPESLSRFSFVRRVEIIKAICDALQYAHERDLVHRDVKPANILIGLFGEVFLTDWGIAKTGSDDPEQASVVDEAETGSSRKTQTGQILGTLAYLAPELIRGSEDANRQSDVYSLGATMYHLFTLSSPYDPHLPAGELLMKIIKDTPPPADQHTNKHQGRVPRHIAMIIEKAMSRDPESRHTNCAELGRELQDYLDGEAPSACVCTWTHNRLAGLSRLLDDHPVPFIVMMVFLIILPMIELGIILALW